MTNIQQIYDKYQQGYPLTDEEFQYGLSFFNDLRDRLFALGPNFYLAMCEANRTFLGLDRLQSQRGIK